MQPAATLAGRRSRTKPAEDKRQAENLSDKAWAAVRSPVEHAFAYLKNWRLLSKGLHGSEVGRLRWRGPAGADEPGSRPLTDGRLSGLQLRICQRLPAPTHTRPTDVRFSPRTVLHAGAVDGHVFRLWRRSCDTTHLNWAYTECAVQGAWAVAAAFRPFLSDHLIVGLCVSLTDAQWARIEPLLPDRRPKRGGRWRDHRQVIDPIAFKYRTGTPWMDLPEHFGSWKGARNRLRMWAADGTWEKVFTALLAQADTEGDLDWVIAVDSTIVRAHQHAPGARQKGPRPASRPTMPSDCVGVQVNVALARFP
ncbi:IS5 family transposase [Streptomyces sp. NBC_00663]|uniref:IS5 family transposase n=1 Tax=Streptomyces sp. NBC_00663 TaxID=2975801 RepID=UPI002E3629FD|nr:IS5 family transposase [Streptomyces sp. NBC_00663]